MNHDSPRFRRLRNDFRAMQQLRSESSILDFDAESDSLDTYVVWFHGKGLYRPVGSKEVELREQHEVLIELGAAYPRLQPELNWKSPIFHPNISGSGVVCLGGYGSYWVPGVGLDQLCCMLWDMIRYQNFDIESPYNRESASWAKNQDEFSFPVDTRPLRDRLNGSAVRNEFRRPAIVTVPPDSHHPAGSQSKPPIVRDEVTFIDPLIVEAEVVESADTGILYIE